MDRLSKAVLGSFGPISATVEIDDKSLVSKLSFKASTAGFEKDFREVLLPALAAEEKTLPMAWEILRNQEQREELPRVMRRIQLSMLRHMRSGQTPFEISPWPLAMPGKGLVDWVRSPGFEKLNWKAPDRVRGQYGISLNPDGGFTVNGRCDIDGDGIFARYSATDHEMITRETAKDIY